MPHWCERHKKHTIDDLCPGCVRMCKLCGDVTNIVFNINFKAVRVCESCATQITTQQVTDWAKKNDGNI